MDNFAGQLDAAAAGAEVELPELELELELSDVLESDFFSDFSDVLDEDSELFAEPFVVLLADSRLSVR